jgi:putative addiction module component (TIGR02574 family)
MSVDIAATLAEIKSLSIDERIALVDAIWDSIDAETENLPLTDAQRQELERRLAHHLANPDDVVSWEVVHAEAMARARR